MNINTPVFSLDPIKIIKMSYAFEVLHLKSESLVERLLVDFKHKNSSLRHTVSYRDL